jgi:hypothetical protein
MSTRIARWVLALAITVTVATTAATQEKAPAKPKGRLPAYYKDVVTVVQKEAIYGIQIKYAEQMDKLEAEIKALTAKRDAEIEGLLSADQKDAIAKAKAAAGKKPVAETDKPKTADNTATDEKPAPK